MEKKTKENCWEFKRCGRQVGGIHMKDLGRCPATLEERLDGVHEGVNAGRACWVVAGTLCKDEVQGTYAQKFKNCQKCDFYEKVRGEQYPRFEFSSTLLSRLK
ncbi:MAG: two-CW domain-containing protein [Thermodesulfovibrionales bacterium]